MARASPHMHVAPPEDRAAFVADNAVSLVIALEARIARQAAELTRLNRANTGLRNLLKREREAVAPWLRRHDRLLTFLTQLVKLHDEARLTPAVMEQAREMVTISPAAALPAAE